MDEAFEMFHIPPTGPLDCNLFSPSTLTPVTAVSYPSTAEASLEAQSMPAPASVFPELGREADNYRTSFRCLPEEKYDGITTKTIVPIEYNGYNTSVAKKQVAEVTSDVVEAGSNMFPDTPQPLGCDMLSPLHSNLILSSPHQMPLLPLLGQTKLKWSMPNSRLDSVCFQRVVSIAKQLPSLEFTPFGCLYKGVKSPFVLVT